MIVKLILWEGRCEDYEGDLLYGHAAFFYAHAGEMSWEEVVDELNSGSAEYIDAVYCDNDHTAELVAQLFEDACLCPLNNKVKGFYKWDPDEREFTFRSTECCG